MTLDPARAGREAETRRQAQEAKLELDRHQVALLRWFVLEFSLRSNRELSGADEFCFRDGSVQLSSSHKASLGLSLRFAGNIAPTPLLEITPEQWDRIVRTHLYGTFYCTVEMVRRFLKPKRAGKIVNVTAPSALRGGNGVADYASAKGGIIAFTGNVARDLLPLNIQVNAVLPVARSRMTDALADFHARFSGEDSAGRLRNLAPPDAVLPVFLFLASSDSDYVTGQVIAADGGLLA